MQTLTWSQLRSIGRFDAANRWYPRPDIAEYFAAIRAPSRAWPSSYAKAAQTQKFARWIVANRPDLAQAFGLVQE